jgi:hypothetical protein
MPTSTGRAMTAGPGIHLVDLHTTTVTTALGGLPVTSGDPDVLATMARLVLPVLPGDILKIVSRARVTNNLGYTVGVGWQHQWYDASLPASQRTFVSLGRWSGDNVDHTRHHLPLGDSHDVWQVPDTWIDGHLLCVAMRVNAHSTAWRSGDELVVEDLTVLTVEQYRHTVPA